MANLANNTTELRNVLQVANELSTSLDSVIAAAESNTIELQSIADTVSTLKKAEKAGVTVHNSSSTIARLYFSEYESASSDYRDVDAGTSTPAVEIGIPATTKGSLVVMRCGTACTVTATSGCSWVMNVTGTSYRAFAFLITESAATITVTDT